MACAIAPVPCPMHFPARNLMTFVNWTEWLDAPRGDFCMGKPPSQFTNVMRLRVLLLTWEFLSDQR